MKKIVLLFVILILIVNCGGESIIKKEYIGRATKIKVLPGSGGWNSMPPMTVITTDKGTTFTVRGTPTVSIGDSCYIVTKKITGDFYEHGGVYRYFKGYKLN